jgi:hypothetical protein
MSYNSLFGLGTHSPDADLAGWWKLDDNAANTTVTDYSGNGNDLTCNTNTSAAYNVESPSAAGIANSYYVNGSTSTGSFMYINSNMGSGANSGDCTLLCWARSDVTSGTDMLIGYHSFITGGVSGGGAGGLYRNSSFHSSHWESSGFGNDLNRNHSGLVADTWYSYGECLDNNGNRSDKHIDGSFISFRSDSGFKNNGSQKAPFWVGANGSSTGSPSLAWQGYIANPAVFNRDLSTAEVQEYYNGPEPINTVAPTATYNGTDEVSTTNGTWDSQSNGTITYTYQWYRADDAVGTNEASISGATSSTYSTTGADDAKFLRCLIAASNDGGNDSSADTYSSYAEIVGGGGGFQAAWAINATIAVSGIA